MKKYHFSFAVFFVIANSLFSQPANDDPCGVITLTIQSGTRCTPTNAFSWTGATASASIPAPGCGSYFTGDIWFGFICPTSGNVNINTKAGSGAGAITDGALAVYGTTGGCFSPFFFIACNDDSIPGTLMPYLSLSGLSPGSVYYIRFWDFNDAVSGNIGGICITDPNPQLAISGAIGIGIDNPDNLLDVNGQVKLRAGNPGTGKVLTSDANGLASWTTLVDPVPFKGTNSVNLSILSGPSTNINFDVEEFDAGSNFSAGVFTVPVTGYYHFDALVYWSLSGITGSTNISLSLKVNGVSQHYANHMVLAGGSGGYTQSVSTDLFLTALQTVQVAVAQTSGIVQTITGNVSGIGKFSYFNGHRIK
jgi:hypothetical protein